MQSFESLRFWRSIWVGVALTLIVCAIDQLGWLSPLDGWFYDERAALCQLFTKPPDPRIEHVDIDEASLDPGALGRWPWSRQVVARIVDEIALTKPAAVGLDILLSEPEKNPAPTTQPAEAVGTADAALIKALIPQQDHLVLAVNMGVQSATALSPVAVQAIQQMLPNLGMNEDTLLHNLRLSGYKFADNNDFQDLFVKTRRAAIADRVTQELDRAPLSDNELVSRLLPGRDSDLITSPEKKVLLEKALAYRTRKAFERFGFTPPQLSVMPIPTELQQLPMKIFSDHAQECGFANYDFFNSPIVRSVPLMVEADDRFYPQFGLTFACAILNADLRKAVVKEDRIEVPVASGPPVEIPTHRFYSKTLHRYFSCVADIPWFGTHDSLTMYDWPNHLRPAHHLSINTIWDICATTDKITKNDKQIDVVINDLFAQDVNFSLDAAFAEQYFKTLPAADDDISRERIVLQALAKLSAMRSIEQFEAMKDRTPVEEAQLAGLRLDRDIMISAMNENKAARRQIIDARQNLANRLGGKGVLIGWTAEGNIDHVATSLHTLCPGVVAHGAIAEAVLSNRWPWQSPNWLDILLVLGLGGLTTFLVADLQPVRATGSTVLLMAGYLLLNGYILFDYGHWIVPVAGPIVTLLAVWSGCTLQRVIYEGVERNRVATEVAIINKEMDLARKVQAALIPKSAPIIPGLVANGWTMAASVAGGDCYDLWTLPDGRLGILLADASGHGLAPAMVVSQVRTLVRALCDVERHPHGLLQRINARVADDLETGRFITVFLGFLSSDGLLEYASAGHGPQFWYGCDGEDMMELDSTGAPLGFDNEWLADEPMPPLQISDGCSLVIFSDGIFEAMDPKGEVYGIDRLKLLLHNARGKSGKVIIDQVITAMEAWQHKHPPADDQTVVIAQRVTTSTR